MALMQTVAVNTLICSTCRVAIAPKQKADGGLAFPLELLHQVPKTRCTRYGSVKPTPAVVEPVITREEKCEARWKRRVERLQAERLADREREETEYRKFLEAGNPDNRREPTEREVYQHRSKLAPGYVVLSRPAHP